MGRRRSKEQAWLPAGVYGDRYGYFTKKPYRRLARADATRSEVWAAFETLGQPHKGTLRWLTEEYCKSDRFQGLASKTRKEAESALTRVVQARTKSGTFGDTPVTAITPGVIRRYLDSRDKPVAANREVAYLSAAFSWAYERDMVKLNPCRGVRRNPEQERDRYVTDEELQAALQSTRSYLRIFIELAYLLAARKGEVLDLRRDDLLPEGVRVRRSKGSKTNIVRWSPRLEQAVNAALGLPSEVASFFLLHDANGQPIRSSTLDTAWQRADLPFTPHDLKRKGVSDSKSDNPAGHRDRRMVARYRVKPEEVEPPE